MIGARHNIAAPGKFFWMGSLEPIEPSCENVVTGYGKYDAVRMFHRTHRGHNSENFLLHRMLLKPSAIICPHLLQSSEEVTHNDQGIPLTHYDAYILEHRAHPVIKDHDISMQAQTDQLVITTEKVPTNWELHDAIDDIN